VGRFGSQSLRSPERCSVLAAALVAALVALSGAALPALAADGPATAASGTPAPSTMPALRPLTTTWPADAAGAPAGDIGRWRFGGALRFRYIELANVAGLGLEANPEYQILRLRTQVWADRRLSPTLSFHGQLVNEASKYLDCEACDGGLREINVDNFYLEAVGPWGIPVGARIGRQNLFYGDGFIVADGTPLDGSRTAYVTGVLVTSAIPLWAFDFFLAFDPAREEYLPRINNKHTALSETDDFVWGLFLKREPAPGTSLRYTFEPYYVYKSEKNPDHESRMARLHTGGARLGFAVGKAEATAEIAYQGGKVPEVALDGAQSVSAVGGHARLAAHLAPPIPLDIQAGYVYLTGDQRDTRNKYEGWNPVLGRWPAWSELYIYTLAAEALSRPMGQGLAYWQNLKMPYLRIAYDRGGPVSLEARYCWLDAFEDLAVDLLPDPTYEGPKHRGELYAFKVSWKLARIASGHLLYERFVPGDFYDVVEGFTPETASYLRFEASRSF
jgi:hypothetical protein